MTAQSPHTPPPDSGADAILHDLLQMGVLWPAVERMLRRRLPEVPGWCRALGPWCRTNDRSTSWARSDHEGHTRVMAWLGGEGTYWAGHRGCTGPYATLHDAMRVGDAEAHEAGHIFDPSLPPEEAPAAEPVPAPAHEAGPGRRAGQHRWELDGGSLWRCAACGRWRLRPLGKGWRYLSAQYPMGHARALLDVGSGETRAGRCPGGRAP